MTPKRHAIAKEIIKLLYPGPPFGGELFFNLFGYICGRDAERRTAGGDGTDAGAGEIVAGQIKNGASPRKRRGLTSQGGMEL